MSEPWEEFWSAEVDSLALEMFERSHEPSFTDDARGMGEAREWASRVIDEVRAAAHREGQVEGMRQAAYVAGDVAPDGMGGNDWFPSEWSDYVAGWLEYRAHWIENGADL